MKRANGLGTCVYDPRIERWRVRLSKKAGGGKRTWLKENGHAMTFATEEEAERILAAISVVESGGADDVIGSCREAFEAELRRRDLEQDRRDQKNDWSTFRVWIASSKWIDWPPSAVATHHGIAWVEAMLQTPVHGRGVRRAGRAAPGTVQLVSRLTVKGALSLATTLFGTLVKKNRLAVNPFLGIRVPGKDVRVSKHFTWRETVAILKCKAIPEIERAVLAVFFGTGARHDEIFLTPQRNLAIGPRDDGAWFVEYGSDAKGKLWGPKNEHQRTVTLFGIALWGAREYARLVEAAGWKNPNKLAFPSRREGRPRYRFREWYQWLEAAKVRTDLDSYKMKHTCASLLLRGEMHHVIREVLGIEVPRRRWTLDELAPLMGHSSIEVTTRYAQFCEKGSDRAAREMMGESEPDDAPPPPPPPIEERLVAMKSIPAQAVSNDVEPARVSAPVVPSPARRLRKAPLSTDCPPARIQRKGNMQKALQNTGIFEPRIGFEPTTAALRSRRGVKDSEHLDASRGQPADGNAVFLLSVAVLFATGVDSKELERRARALLAAVPLLTSDLAARFDEAIAKAREIVGAR